MIVQFPFFWVLSLTGMNQVFAFLFGEEQAAGLNFVGVIYRCITENCSFSVDHWLHGRLLALF